MESSLQQVNYLLKIRSVLSLEVERLTAENSMLKATIRLQKASTELDLMTAQILQENPGMDFDANFKLVPRKEVNNG